MGVQFLFPQYNSSLAQATSLELLCLLNRARRLAHAQVMSEECKLFIGGLLPQVLLCDLVLWMGCLSSCEPDELHMMPLAHGAPYSCAFATYRRASD